MSIIQFRTVDTFLTRGRSVGNFAKNISITSGSVERSTLPNFERTNPKKSSSRKVFVLLQVRRSFRSRSKFPSGAEREPGALTT